MPFECLPAGKEGEAPCALQFYLVRLDVIFVVLSFEKFLGAICALYGRLMRSPVFCEVMHEFVTVCALFQVEVAARVPQKRRLRREQPVANVATKVRIRVLAEGWPVSKTLP